MNCTDCFVDSNCFETIAICIPYLMVHYNEVVKHTWICFCKFFPIIPGCCRFLVGSIYCPPRGLHENISRGFKITELTMFHSKEGGYCR